ncbi:MAG: NRDE family protein [Deltaproteobacteria bacterium]
MCTLAIYHRYLPGLPVLVAANRDEFLARPTRGPMVLETMPQIIGGRDEVAGGSWLTLSEHGLIVGVLNRRTPRAADPALRSRGELCLELARCPDATAAAKLLAATPTDRHNPFNILVADTTRAFVAQNRRAGMDVEELAPGLHVLTNLDLDDHECTRISHSWQHFEATGEAFCRAADRSALLSSLRRVLADHRTAVDDRQPTDQLCIHTSVYGTRSSSIILIDDKGEKQYFHAAGAPCRTPYRKIALRPSAAAPSTTSLDGIETPLQ